MSLASSYPLVPLMGGGPKAGGRPPIAAGATGPMAEQHERSAIASGQGLASGLPLDKAQRHQRALAKSGAERENTQRDRERDRERQRETRRERQIDRHIDRQIDR